MATETLKYSTTLTVIDCGVCRCPFAIPTSMYEKVRNDGSGFYCPNGHSLVYRKTENDKLRRDLEHANDMARWHRDQREAAERQAGHERRRAAAARGQLTKIRNRVANGVCPVAGCKRSFSNVIEHLRYEHPDYHRHEEAAS